MADFVDLPITTSASELLQAFKDYLASVWPDWQASDADPENVIAEALAPMAENAAVMAANMPAQALIAFGVKLLGQPYESGASAYTTVRLTMQDAAGYTVPAMSGLNIDGYGFVLTADAVCPPGSTTVDTLAASTDLTAAANGLTGVLVAPLSMPGFVTGISVLAPTSGGADPQSDSDYLDQISRDRRLNSRAIISLLDFELAALDQPGIGRAHADNTGSRNVTVTVVGTDGNAVPTATKTALANVYAQRRLVNVTTTIADPTFTTVNVTYTVVSEAGMDPTDLQSRINAALISELSSIGWGIPSTGEPGGAQTTWINDPNVYAWRLVQVIGQQQGVHRVTALSINGGANGADLILSGTVPMPRAGTMTGSIL